MFLTGRQAYGRTHFIGVDVVRRKRQRLASNAHGPHTRVFGVVPAVDFAHQRELCPVTRSHLIANPSIKKPPRKAAGKS
jgi:hypothetical protein